MKLEDLPRLLGLVGDEPEEPDLDCAVAECEQAIRNVDRFSIMRERAVEEGALLCAGFVLALSFAWLCGIYRDPVDCTFVALLLPFIPSVVVAAIIGLTPPLPVTLEAAVRVVCREDDPALLGLLLELFHHVELGNVSTGSAADAVRESVTDRLTTLTADDAGALTSFQREVVCNIALIDGWPDDPYREPCDLVPIIEPWANEGDMAAQACMKGLAGAPPLTRMSVPLRDPCIRRVAVAVLNANRRIRNRLYIYAAGYEVRIDRSLLDEASVG